MFKIENPLTVHDFLSQQQFDISPSLYLSQSRSRAYLFHKMEHGALQTPWTSTDSSQSSRSHSTV